MSQPPFRPSPSRRKQQALRVATEQLSEFVPGRPRDEEDTKPVDIDALNEAWGIPGAIEFGLGQGDLPTVLITHPQTDMQMVVYLYGATIAQWRKSDGTATFYDGPDELYQEGMPLRTGVSVHFPQHRDGLLPQHGFADGMMWEVVGAGFDCPEYVDQLTEYWQLLEAHGVLSPELAEAALSGKDEKAAAEVTELLASAPPGGMVDSDMAPFVTLRLRDTPATRAMWPHRFELTYKITLMCQDPLTPEDEREILASHGVDPDMWLAEDAADDERIMQQAAEDEDEDQGGGDDDEDDDVVVFAGRAAGRRKAAAAKKTRAAKAKGKSGKGAEEEDGEEGEDGPEVVAELELQPEADDEDGDEEGGPKAGKTARPGRRGRAPAAAAESEEADGEADGEGEDDGDDDEADAEAEAAAALEAAMAPPEGPEDGVGGEDPIGPAVQIKQEFWVRNRDSPGSEPMAFNLGWLARFATMMQPECSDWVKVLGLGGSQTFDYTADPRYPKLDMCEEDFIHFRGEPIDTTYVGAADATVYLCPGNRTHFEFIRRAGFRDMFIQQPSHQADPDYTRVAAIGSGYLATEKKLAPGAEWYAESVIRFHERYWRQPIFGDDSMPPLPPIPREFLAADDEEGEGVHAFDGLPADPTAAGAGAGAGPGEGEGPGAGGGAAEGGDGGEE